MSAEKLFEIILGLDLGTNSIGAALIKKYIKTDHIEIIDLISRILPASQGANSPASDKTMHKSHRKLIYRFQKRRERLNIVLDVMQALPKHYKNGIKWNGSNSAVLVNEVKIPYEEKAGNKPFFIFEESYEEMLKDIFPKESERKNIPKDCTLYYLRQKALKEKISLQQLAWVLSSFNQKRGYEHVRGVKNNEAKYDSEFKEISKITKVKGGYEFQLCDLLSKEVQYTYFEETTKLYDKVGDKKEVIFEYEEDGTTIKKKLINDYRCLKIENRQKNDKEKLVLQLENGKQLEFKYFPKGLDMVDVEIEINLDLAEKGKDKTNVKKIDKDKYEFKKKIVEKRINEFLSKDSYFLSDYYYKHLKENYQKNTPTQINGKLGLIQTIDRSFYRKDLHQILKTQFEKNDYLKDNLKDIQIRICERLFPKNEDVKRELKKINLRNLIADTIIMYQRPLKSSKHLVANCFFEFDEVERINDKGEKFIVTKPKKVIAASHPFYQEFRIWDKISNIKIFQKLENENGNESQLVCTDEKMDVIKLFEALDTRKDMNEKQFLDLLGLKPATYSWNMSKRNTEKRHLANTTTKIRGNETKYQFLECIKFVDESYKNKIWNRELELALWQFFYAAQQKDIEKGLRKIFKKHLIQYDAFDEELLENLVDRFKNIDAFPKSYGAFSMKTIKKLLPLMRVGKYWTAMKKEEQNIDEGLCKKEINRIADKRNYLETCIDPNTRKRIDKIINAEEDDFIDNFTREKLSDIKSINDCQGMPFWKAKLLVYGTEKRERWTTTNHIKEYLRNEFKPNCLRSPVVEKVVRETLSLIIHIWEEYGNGDEKFFDKIHVELAREMSKTQKEKEAIEKKNKINHQTNIRLKMMLKMLSDDLKKQNKNVFIDPQSNYQLRKLRIFEDGIRFRNKDEDIVKKKKGFIATEYYDWLKEQVYHSPYTNHEIRLGNLFNTGWYEIEHVLPQAKISFNTMRNLVICEAEINREKSDSTGFYFVSNEAGTVIDCDSHQNIKLPILSVERYKEYVKGNFPSKKANILLSTDIPKGFLSSQLNNTRHISRKIMELASNIVREEGENEFKSKNVLNVNGKVTSKLRQDWGLNELWNELMAPRFQTQNKVLGGNYFGEIVENDEKSYFRSFLPYDIDELDTLKLKIGEIASDKKRIDHRHHALDALIVGLCTLEHVHYQNNVKSERVEFNVYREQLKKKLTYRKENPKDKSKSSRVFYLPLQSNANNQKIKYQFTKQTSNDFGKIVKQALENVIVTFKTNQRLLNKATNYYQKYNEEGKKVWVSQNEESKKTNKKVNWSVRNRLHKDSYYGNAPEKLKIPLNAKNWKNYNSKKIKDSKWNKKIEDRLKNGETITQISKSLDSFWIENINNSFVCIRKPLSSMFKDENGRPFKNDKTISVIEEILDPTLRKIILKHFENIKKQKEDAIVEAEKNNVDKKEIEKLQKDLDLTSRTAFFEDGIDIMNRDIIELNNKKHHYPIHSVRVLETMGAKKTVGKNGVKAKKYVINAKGVNAYVAYYENDKGERKFHSYNFRDLIEKLKVEGNKNLFPALHPKDKKYKLQFVLSPKDLVYLPTEQEIKNPDLVTSHLSIEQKKRIFCLINYAGSNHFFRPITYASGLHKLELEYQVTDKGTILKRSQKEKSVMHQGEPIKDTCWKIDVNRLGKIRKIYKPEPKK